MISIGAMLMNSPAPRKEETKRTAYSSKNVLQSLEKNASKPCSACGNPERHRAKSGRIYTTLCTKCYLERNRIAKQRGK